MIIVPLRGCDDRRCSGGKGLPPEAEAASVKSGQEQEVVMGKDFRYNAGDEGKRRGRGEGVVMRSERGRKSGLGGKEGHVLS